MSNLPMFHLFIGVLLLLFFAHGIDPFPSTPRPHSVAFSTPEKARFGEVRLVVSSRLRKILHLNARERIRRLTLPTEVVRVSGRSNSDLMDTAVRQLLPLGNLPYVIHTRERRTTSAESSLLAFKSSDPKGVVNNFYIFVDIDPEHRRGDVPVRGHS